ncbi:TonB-dependent receptor [Phocaeicola sp.]
MRKLLYLLCIMLTVASATVSAENANEAARRTVKGIVHDENGDPLPGASVVVVGTTLGAGTNSNGEFAILLNDNKKQKLRISFTGYHPLEVEVATPINNKQPIIVELLPAENQLNEVVVTGSRIEKPLKEVPVLTRVITNKDIQVLNPMNIETLLQYELPGLQIGYNSMSQMPEITYQGVGGEYLLFLVDGERVSGEGADHNVDFTRFNVDDIERIEVIKGSQSTVYGSNALGGVINIITKNANRPFTGNLSARYAGSNGQKYSASVGTKQKRLSSLSSLTYRTKDTYTISDNEDVTTTVYGYKIWDASQKFGYTFTDKLSAEVKGSLYHNERDIRVGRKYQDFFIDYTLNGKVKYVINEDQQLNVSYIYDNYKKDKDYFDAGFTRTDYRNRTQTVRADYVGTFGDHTLSAGVEGNFEYLKHYMMKDSANASVETYALYLQEDWKISETLNIIAGLRGDYHRKYHLHVTPKISAMYRPCNVFTLRAGYSQGFRSPSLKELYQEYDMGGQGWMMLYGNPDLKPETSNQYSISAEATKGGLNVSVSAYHNRFKNKIAYASLGDGTSDQQYINAEKAKTTGVEAIAQWRMNFGLTVSGSYAYVDDYQEVEGKNTSSVRPHSVTFNAMYTHKFGKVGTNLSLNGQWTSKLDTYSFSTNGEYELTSYNARTLCTLNAGVQLPKGISLNVGIDNLFNFKDKAADSSLQLPQKGISYVGTVSINLADMFKL